MNYQTARVWDCERRKYVQVLLDPVPQPKRFNWRKFVKPARYPVAFLIWFSATLLSMYIAQALQLDSVAALMCGMGIGCIGVVFASIFLHQTGDYYV